MESLAILVLAAGLGKRMGSTLPKVVTKTRERALIQHVLASVSELKASKVVVITGYQKELVQQVVEEGRTTLYPDTPIEFAWQREQLGTGDAVKAALPNLKGFSGTVMIVCGDSPLVRPQTLQALLAKHHADKATISLLSLKTIRPASYGRIVRESTGRYVEKIVEARDCTPDQLTIDEINTSIYAVDSAFLEPAVTGLSNENAQKEYYLTDIVARAASEGQRVSALLSFDEEELQGVNTLEDLSRVNQTLLSRTVYALINRGVEIAQPLSTIIDATVQIGAGTKIGPAVQILGNSKIGTNVTIEGTAYISDSIIDDGACIKLGVRMEKVHVGPECSVGPFAHLRPETTLGREVKIGNFVETKKSTFAEGAKASHLSYIGDCDVGADANIGAGTITCNYDGKNKHQTSIGAGAFIGSNSALVAPVSIGANALVGAGSVITKEVPADSLAVARAKQVVKEGWRKR